MTNRRDGRGAPSAHIHEVNSAMLRIVPGPNTHAASLEGETDPSRLASCPLCHTAHPFLTQVALDAGEDWQCARCGQRWDAERLATVAAYAAWVVEQENPSRMRSTADTRGSRASPPAAGRS
jgi:hypothetical protein